MLPGPAKRAGIVPVRAAASAASAAGAGQLPGPLKYQHIMLAIVDPSPHFGDGSKQVRWRLEHAVIARAARCLR
jgi:hypothetical protein